MLSSSSSTFSFSSLLPPPVPPLCFLPPVCRSGQLSFYHPPSGVSCRLARRPSSFLFSSISEASCFPPHFSSSSSSSSLPSSSSLYSPFSSLGLEAGMLVQSNFKVYVYTASPLQMSVLAHLCELQAHLPNLIVGLLTRVSVLAAFRSGISANQIIRFLEAHAHPVIMERKLRTNTPIIPENVTIQLRMWEAERMRLSLFPAILLKRWEPQFMPELYIRSVRFAVARNYALYFTPWPEGDLESEEFHHWMQEKEKYLVVHAEYKPEVVEKIREIRTEIVKDQAEMLARSA